MKNFRRSTTKIYWMNTVVSNFLGKVVGVTILNILKTKSAMLLNFCIVNTPRCQILICGTENFVCFSRFLPVKRLFQKMDSIEKSNPSPPSTPILTPLSYSGVIRVKMFVLKHWVFL